MTVVNGRIAMDNGEVFNERVGKFVTPKNQELANPQKS
jgi:hypothetical protein